MLGQCPAPVPRARRICLRLLPDTFPAFAGVTAGTPWLTSRSSSSRSKRSWRPWSASGSACTAAGAEPDLTLRRRLIGLIWTLTFGGMQWRVAGWLSGVPFTTLHSTFARWARLGLWRRLGQRLAGGLAPGLRRQEEVLPSAVVADSRSLRSAPTAWTRGIECLEADQRSEGVRYFCDKHRLAVSTSNWGRPTRMTARAPCRHYPGWPRSVSKAICLATAASRGRRSRRRRWCMTSTSRSRPAEHGTGVSYQRDQMGRWNASSLG